MSLRVKLLLAQVPLAAALVLVCVVASVNVSSLGRESQGILKDNYRSVLSAQGAKDAIERLEDLPARGLIGALADSIGVQAAPYLERVEQQVRLQEDNITEPGEVQATIRLRQAWARYREQFDLFLSQQDPAQARALFVDRLEPAFAGVKDAADTVLAINQDAIVQKSERAYRSAERMNALTVAVSLTALLVGGALSIALTAKLLQPLGLLTHTVHRIGEGDFESRVNIAGRDELAQLATTINAMAARLTQYRHSSLGDLLLAQQASQAAIDSLPDPVVVFEAGGAVLNANRAAEDLLGVGVKPFAELAPELRAVFGRVCAHVSSGMGPFTPSGFEEAIAVPADEGVRYLLPRASAVYGESGEIAGTTVVLQDVTRAHLIDQLRDDLVATVAHELRTPLTSLRMALHMCLERVAGPLTDRQADLLYTAREDCERLQSMVDQLLDLARIQGGKIELQRRPTAPQVLIEEVYEQHRRAAAEGQLVFQTVVLPGLPDVDADRERVQLVLSNLVSNATRHTPPGGSIELRAVSADGAVRFEVADTGPGIPEPYRATVFDKFVRVPGAVSGGAGLGLSICREIVEAHGGKIGVEPTPGGGATFWVTLPASRREGEAVT